MFNRNRALKAKERIDLYRFLSVLERSGQNHQEASLKVAETLEQEAKKSFGGRNRSLEKSARIYRQIATRIREGKPLHKSLSGLAPDAEILMIMAGEQGDLQKGLKAAEVEASAVQEMRDGLVRGMIYPGILMIFAGIAMWFVGSSLLPTIAKTVSLDDWSSSQRNFYWATTHMEVWLPIVILAIALLVWLVRLINERWVGRSREGIQWLPPFNIIRKMKAASFLTTFSSLIMAGEPLDIALNRIIKNNRSPYLAFYLREAKRRLETGEGRKGPGQIISDSLFSPWIKVRLRIYGDGGIETFAERLQEIADVSRNEALGAVRLISTIINVLLMVAVAAIIVMAVSTMYSVTGGLDVGAQPY